MTNIYRHWINLFFTFFQTNIVYCFHSIYRSWKCFYFQLSPDEIHINTLWSDGFWFVGDILIFKNNDFKLVMIIASVHMYSAGLVNNSLKFNELKPIWCNEKNRKNKRLTNALDSMAYWLDRLCFFFYILVCDLI